MNETREDNEDINSMKITSPRTAAAPGHNVHAAENCCGHDEKKHHHSHDHDGHGF